VSGAKGLGTVLVTGAYRLADGEWGQGPRGGSGDVRMHARLPLGAVPAPAMGDPPVRAWSVA